MEKKKVRKDVELFLNENIGAGDSKYLIERIEKKFLLANASAKTYFYNWKSNYMNSSQCTPNNVKKSMKANSKVQSVLLVGKVYKGECGEYIVSENGVQVGEMNFRNLDELNKYRVEEVQRFQKQLHEIEQVFECGF